MSWRATCTSWFPRLVPVVSLLAAAGCEEPGVWEGYAHTDPERPAFYEFIGTHDTLESCFRMGYAFLNYHRSVAEGFYECGLNCRWYAVDDGLVKRCERIARGEGRPGSG
jgi:hypothetical protein